jgi:hypothetical protein
VVPAELDHFCQARAGFTEPTYCPEIRDVQILMGYGRVHDRPLGKMGGVGVPFRSETATAISHADKAAEFTPTRQAVAAEDQHLEEAHGKRQPKTGAS